MIYSTEIENMCQVKKGANHDPAPIHFRFYPWNRMVCTSTGMLQIDIKR